MSSSPGPAPPPDARFAGGPRRDRAARVRDALLWGVLLGASGGAVLGASIEDVGALSGAVAGALVMTAADVGGRLLQKPGQVPPLFGRIVASALLMAIAGGALGLVLGSGSGLIVAVASGLLLGALGLRAAKVALGLGCGVVVGLVGIDLAPAVTAAAVTVVYRCVSAFVYRGRPLTRLMAEEVPASQLPFVVPFEARTKYVGADYVKQLAELRGGTFVRNPPDVGIIASLDDLAGPAFDPARVHPLIREFYEHTSRFKLSIVPEWRPWMKPVYELFKHFVAEPLGQAAIPSNIEQAQRGMVSTIDTIDLDDDEIVDIRGWIRTFADSGEPIYVGIYTTFRHEGRGYVSVGFPIPGSNFTATLLPRNAGGDGLGLTSRSELPFPGHYLSTVDGERDALTVLKLLSFAEQIDVYVDGGELRTDHSFALVGRRFLTLRYEIARL